MTIPEDLVDRKAGYSAAGVVKALFLLSREPHGRFELMERLHLTEAPARTMLKNLAKGGLIRPTMEGAVLTGKGRALFGKISRRVPALPVEINARTYTDSGLYRKLYRNRRDMAVLVRGAAQKVRDGVEQRDTAVKSGAVGATTFVQKNGKLVFPSTWYEIKKEFNDYLKKLFGTKDNDVIIVCFSPSASEAEEAALIVALSLI